MKGMEPSSSFYGFKDFINVPSKGSSFNCCMFFLEGNVSILNDQ